jgi:23S rRNA (adenine1618-N6)-methyltransferase
MNSNKKLDNRTKTVKDQAKTSINKYDFDKLIIVEPLLIPYVLTTVSGTQSINFSNPTAVKLLNKAILKLDYKIEYWDIPTGYLCPPIPGRALYINQLAEFLAIQNKGVIPRGKNINCLDLGTGANFIYALLGTALYQWSFVGSDIDPIAIKNAELIIKSNHILAKNKVRLQNNAGKFFNNIILDGELYDAVVCNPPFHSSREEANKASQRKVNNLGKSKGSKLSLNFGGQSNELWITGGELAFISKMISESKEYGNSCLWFTTLVSKESNLAAIYNKLEEIKCSEFKTIPINIGHKTSRIIAWTFLDKKQQENWINYRWA